jgi:hypothetical protein
MDWTTFLLGAIAGIYVWNKLNPQVRDLILSLFDQGDSLLISMLNTAAQGATETTNRDHNEEVGHALGLGRSRRAPVASESLLNDGSALSRYLYMWLKGLMLTIPPVANPVSVQQVPNTAQQ